MIRFSSIFQKPIKVIFFRLIQELKLLSMYHLGEWARLNKRINNWWDKERTQIFVSVKVKNQIIISANAKNAIQYAREKYSIDQQNLMKPCPSQRG